MLSSSEWPTFLQTVLVHLNLNKLHGRYNFFYIYKIYIFVVWMKFRCPMFIMLLLWHDLSINCVAALPFINHIPWPYGTVKCPSTAHFRIWAKAVGHLCTFHLLFFTNTMILDTLHTFGIRFWINYYYFFCIVYLYFSSIIRIQLQY